MTKFFRKYMKEMLAVFMALLLIVWLGGSALQNLMSGSNSDRLISRTKRGDILEIHRRIANSEVTLLGRLGINWKASIFGAASQGRSLGILEWIMLTREAEAYGFTVRRVEAEQFLEGIGRTPDVVYGLAKKEDIKPEAIYSAVAKFVAMRKLANLAVASATRSEAEVQVAARDQLEKVKINLVALKASTFVHPDQTFDEEVIQAHFAKYRDRDPGPGLEFGYRLPEQVRVQYFKIDIDKIAANVRIPERTLERQAEEFWRRNRELPAFIKPKEPTPEDQPAEAEPDKSDSQYFATFAEARDEAIKAVRRKLAESKIDDIAGWLLRELAEPWYDTPQGDDGYNIGPPEVVSPDHYAELLKRLPNALRYGDAISIGTTEFFTKSECFAKAPELSQGSFQDAGRGGARSFRDAAFRVQGIATMPTDPGAATSDFLALGQTHPLMISGREGHRYVFRVIEVKPAGPPDDLDQVRDRVLADLRLAAGFDEAKRRADDILQSVTLDGLKAAFDANEEMQELLQPPSGYFTPAPFARSLPGFAGRPNFGNIIYVSGVGRVSREFVDACFALGQTDDTPKVQVIPVEDSATVTVVEWVETLPLRQDEYLAQRDRIYQQLNRSVVARASSEWFDPVRIRDRNGFTATP